MQIESMCWRGGTSDTGLTWKRTIHWQVFAFTNGSDPALTNLGSSYDKIRGVCADSGSCKIHLVVWSGGYSGFSNHSKLPPNITYPGQFHEQEVRFTDSITGDNRNPPPTPCRSPSIARMRLVFMPLQPKNFPWPWRATLGWRATSMSYLALSLCWLRTRRRAE